ncbi:MltA domain-containing protein [Pseudodesulfovibrio sp. JC047]|uniref:murein transglycosylase A n=1 Tax=Pseudodesulfovibrio sp. JC047 TaxID=2683199 RepID=UPI001EF2FEBA|nr:MltA domain-containing protein [Pseudodesulfovibrio sp. JC047]
MSPQPVLDGQPTYVPLEADEAEDRANTLSGHMQGLESWTDLKPALERSLRYIRSRPADTVCVDQPGLRLTWAQLGESVTELLGMLEALDEDIDLVAERFQWFKLAPRTLLTGYYEPWLDASLTQDEKYAYPMYGVPDDLQTSRLGAFHPRWKGESLVYRMGENGIEPYYDRTAIDRDGALAGRGHEIAWGADRVDVFFLQIEGSGRLAFPDGSAKHILYAGKNGRQYVSIGRLLIDQGYIPKEAMSMQRIRSFLEEHPEKIEEILYANPSYVFFRLADEGPYGSFGNILTPRVSVAVDRTMIPLGSVLALKTSLLATDGTTEPFMSLVLAHDTGGAIKGTRMDLFCGSGEDAAYVAGHLQADSEVFMLVSKKVLSATSEAKN